MNRIAPEQIQEWLEFRAVQESDGFVELADREDEIIERLTLGPKQFGAPMPWKKTHEAIRFRPRELTIWAGINGGGKSSMISHLLLSWMLHGPVAVASFEMPLAALGEKTVRQASGHRCSADTARAVLAKTRGRYFVYDECDTVDSERVLAMAIFAAQKLGCQHVVIDSLVKCGLQGSDNVLYSTQRDFVDRLAWIAKTYRTHVHLVHHMRKAGSEAEMGDKFSVKGAGEITDLADNVCLIWRNKPKERKLEEQAWKTADEQRQIEAEPDTVLSVVKQRHGEWEGQINLWFEPESQQFLGNPGELAVKLL